jgi:histone acetyltransferase (RNA polymerase elongator complex component)
LPGDTLERFLASIDRTISIRPSFVRLYPAIVLTGTEMERWYNEGQYRPWSLEEAVEACDLAVERLTAGGINIAKVGLHSDIPQGHIVAGPFHHNLGELVRARGMFRHVEDSPEANRALIVSGYDVSLLKGAPGRYYDTYRERYGDIPIYIDRNMPKSRFLVVNSDSQETRNLGLFR